MPASACREAAHGTKAESGPNSLYQDSQLGTRSGLNPIPAKRRRATGCSAQSRPTPVQDWTDYADLTGRGVGFDSCRIHHAITGGTAVSFKAAIPAGRIRPFGASGTIGDISLGIDMESPAGYAFHTGQIVISNHLQDETRFRTPKLLADHGVKRAINVLIARGGEGHLPFGVLEVDSPDLGQFDLADANFLAGFAGLLGIAIERQHADAELQSSLDHQGMLTREMSHRVKNSLASVVGLLRVQARNAQSEDVQNALKDAASRITTLAEVHDHLWRSKQIGFVDIADFAGELCHKLQETSPGHKLHFKFGNLMISADKAIPLGLLINELVTNAAKHAYPNGSGEIQVTGEQRGGVLHVEVSDQGIGLPKDFDIDQPRASLGFKVIKSLLGQLDGRITVSSNQPK